MKPQLRFPKFTDEWQVKKLGDVSRYSRERIAADELSSANFVGVDSLISKLGGKSVSRHMPKAGKVTKFINGDIVHSNIRPYLKKAWLADAVGGASADALVIHPESGLIKSEFLYYQITSDQYFEYVMSGAKGVKMPRGDKSHIMDYSFAVPILVEQEKIADFLTVVDERIELMDKKVELSKAYKKGLMQKLFPAKDQTNPSLRFKKPDGYDFPDWHIVSLSELLEYEQPTSYIVQSVEYDDTYDTPVLTAGKTFILGYTNEKNGIKDARRNPVIIFDDFTTASHFVDFNFKVKSSAMKILKRKAETPMKLTYELLNQINYEVGDHKRHWIGEYQNLPVKLPFHIKEQEKVADFLSSVDEKIKEQERKLDQAKQFKKTILQQIFV